MVVAALSLVACGGGDAGQDTSGSSGSGSSGDAKPKVVFGLNTQLSGDLQIYGIPAKQGFELGAKAINDAGGIKVGNKVYEATAYTADNRSDPSAVASAARDVLDHHAITALAPDIGGEVAYNIWKGKAIVWTANAPLQQQILEEPAKDPLLFAVIPFVTELYARDVKQVKILYPDVERVAILAPNHQEGKSAMGSYEAGAKAAGMEVVATDLYAPSTNDFSSVLTSMKTKKPDLLIALQSPEQALAILQQAADLGVARYGLNDTMLPDRVLASKSLGKMTVVIPNYSPTFSPAATIPDYKPDVIFGSQEPPDNAGGVIITWYAAQLVAQAMEAAGTVDDAPAIAKKLVGQSHAGPFGTCKVSDRRALECETVVFVVHDGAVKVNRFRGPDATAPSHSYECRDSKCTKVN